MCHSERSTPGGVPSGTFSGEVWKISHNGLIKQYQLYKTGLHIAIRLMNYRWSTREFSVGVDGLLVVKQQKNMLPVQRCGIVGIGPASCKNPFNSADLFSKLDSDICW